VKRRLLRDENFRKNAEQGSSLSTHSTRSAMGLSGAAKKQRIQDDPRNLRWAQGQSLLSLSTFFISSFTQRPTPLFLIEQIHLHLDSNYSLLWVGTLLRTLLSETVNLKLQFSLMEVPHSARRSLQSPSQKRTIWELE